MKKQVKPWRAICSAALILMLVLIATDGVSLPKLSPQELFLKEINAIRKENGAAPLVWDKDVEKLTETRIYEIAEFFSFTRPNDEPNYTVMIDADFELAKKPCEILLYGYSQKELVSAINGTPYFRELVSKTASRIAYASLVDESGLEYFCIWILPDELHKNFSHVRPDGKSQESVLSDLGWSNYNPGLAQLASERARVSKELFELPHKKDT